ncbi:hypothetical protein [Carnobacterium iners]|uniref:hypothetical protein n=1 Tax=Carnobacterium iners TaxID=1073423 RepID=UPI000A1CA1AE|nr:hypothetical protein [Carnobacterium iners]
MVEDTSLHDMSLPEINPHLLSAWKLLREAKPFDELSEGQQEKVTLFSGYTEKIYPLTKLLSLILFRI